MSAVGTNDDLRRCTMHAGPVFVLNSAHRSVRTRHGGDGGAFLQTRPSAHGRLSDLRIEQQTRYYPTLNRSAVEGRGGMRCKHLAARPADNPAKRFHSLRTKAVERHAHLVQDV